MQTSANVLMASTNTPDRYPTETSRSSSESPAHQSCYHLCLHTHPEKHRISIFEWYEVIYNIQNSIFISQELFSTT